MASGRLLACGAAAGSSSHSLRSLGHLTRSSDGLIRQNSRPNKKICTKSFATRNSGSKPFIGSGTGIVSPTGRRRGGAVRQRDGFPEVQMKSTIQTSVVSNRQISRIPVVLLAAAMALSTVFDSPPSLGQEVRLPPNAELNASGNDWKCKRGYRRVNNECEAKTGNGNWVPVIPLFGRPAGKQAADTASGDVTTGATAAGGAVAAAVAAAVAVAAGDDAASTTTSTSTSTSTSTATSSQ